MATAASTAPPRTLAPLRYLTISALIGWGLLHLVGGAILLRSALDGTGISAVESLGSATSPNELQTEPGRVVQQVIAFHAFNIAAAGLAVAAIGATIVRRRWPLGITSALTIVAVLDAGLVVFLVGPGYMKASDGIWGPILLAVAAAAAWACGWRPRQL